MFIFHADKAGNTTAINTSHIIRLFQIDNEIYITMVDDEIPAELKEVQYKAVTIFAGADAESANKKMRQFFKAVSNGAPAFYFGGE